MKWLESSRDRSVDIIRSFAFITMMLANMAPILAEPHGLLFRLAGSFAAPLFIAIAGMMVVLTCERKSYHVGHFLLRGALIIIVGVAVDAGLWHVLPFTTVDILYLIGVSLPVAYLVSKLPARTILLTALVVFGLSQTMQHFLGYTTYPTEYELGGALAYDVPGQTGILNHWLVDGWFPILPWTGFMFFGVYLAKLRWNGLLSTGVFARGRALLAGLGVLTVGAVVWYFYPGALMMREGYSEMFYPPTMGFIVTALGVLLVAMFAVDKTCSWKFWGIVTPLGEAPLLMYVVHIAVAARIYIAQFEGLSMGLYLLLYAVLMVSMIVLAHLVRLIKLRVKDMPYMLGFILGS